MDSARCANFDGGVATHIALVIVAVRENDESVPDGMIRVRIHQLFFASFIDGVIGAVPSPERSAGRPAEQKDVVGKVLRHLPVAV